MTQIFLNSNLEYENAEKRYFIEGDQLSLKKIVMRSLFKKHTCGDTADYSSFKLFVYLD